MRLANAAGEIFKRRAASAIDPLSTTVTKLSRKRVSKIMVSLGGSEWRKRRATQTKGGITGEVKAVFAGVSGYNKKLK